MKLFEKIADIVLGRIVEILAIALIGGISWIALAGRWTEVIFTLLLSQIMIVVYLLYSHLKEHSNLTTSYMYKGHDTTVWNLFMDYPHKKMNWKIYQRNFNFNERLSFATNEAQIPTEISVGILPFCPKCKTETDESKNLFGRYVWKCANCGFKKTNKDDCIEESNHVEKIVKSKIENGEIKIINQTLY